MNKDKYDFIIDLIESKNLSTSQKDKVLELSIRELKKEKLNEEEIRNRIIKIESALNLNEEGGKPSSNEIEYKNPAYTVKFLQDFNKDPILKTTCHEIDEDELQKILSITKEDTYNFHKHHAAITDAFNLLVKNHPNADYKIKALIRGYISGRDKKNDPITGWSTNSIKINWYCDELLSWVEDNPGIPPNPDIYLSEKFNSLGFEFDEISDLHLKTFSELVIHFKKLFHIRKDNSLLSYITKINEHKKWNEVIDFTIDGNSFKSNLEFFSDVDKLCQAYNKIIYIIIEASKKVNKTKPKVRLSLQQERSQINFSICHLNSVFSKSADNLIERIGQKHLNLIENQINGLCDLHIQADFDNGAFYRINLWDGNERQKTILDSCTGVEHILVFK